MDNCDPAYEICPVDSSPPMIENSVIAAMNPFIYAWAAIPLLNFISGFGNKNAWNSYLDDWNAAG
jgi:hypothetical protein